MRSFYAEGRSVGRMVGVRVGADDDSRVIIPSLMLPALFFTPRGRARRMPLPFATPLGCDLVSSQALFSEAAPERLLALSARRRRHISDREPATLPPSHQVERERDGLSAISSSKILRAHAPRMLMLELLDIETGLVLDLNIKSACSEL